MDLQIHAKKLVTRFLKESTIGFSKKQNEQLQYELTDFMEKHLKTAYKVGRANGKHFKANWGIRKV